MSTIMCTMIPATAKKRNNFACCKMILPRDDFLYHFPKILFNNTRMKVNKCFGVVFCRVCVHAPAFKRITDRCDRFQAWSSTLCALNEFICIVLPVFCTTPLCIFIEAEVPNIQSVYGSRWKKSLFPNYLKFAFIFTITIMFLSFLMRSDIYVMYVTVV